MKQLLVFALVLLVNFTLFGQLGDVKVETRNGEKVYVHVAQKGNTLWGLYKLYDVPVETIVKANPGIENGIQEGQTVYIPVTIITESKKHKVAAGETLFSIARKYDVSVADLEKWNAGVSQGLKEGQELTINLANYVTGEKAQVAAVTPEKKPADTPIKITFDDNVVEHVVEKGETLYSISRRYMVSQETIISFNQKKNGNINPGEVLRIPLKKERVSKVDVREIPAKETPKTIDTGLIYKQKNEFRVAILMPFFLDKGPGSSDAISNMSAEFVMGAQLALDSLEKLGLNAKVYVYDTENSKEKINAILSKPEFSDMDLIIGPLFKEHAYQIADWCLSHKVRMVCPVNVDAKILQNNPYVYTTIGSDITLMKGMGRYLAKNFKGGKIVLIKPSNAQDSSLYQAFRTEYNRTAGLGGTKLIEISPNDFSTYLSYSSKTAFVYPTNDAKSASNFMNSVSKLVHKYGNSTYIFGTEAWLDMGSINAFYRNKYRITVPSSLDLNYTYERTKQVHRKYRSVYKSDFTKFAIQGYDVTFHYCAELLIGRTVGQLIMNNFEPVQVGPNHGFENRRTEILTHDNFNLKNVSNGIE